MKWIQALTKIGLAAIALTVATPLDAKAGTAGTFTFVAGCLDLANCSCPDQNSSNIPANPSDGLQMWMETQSPPWSLQNNVAYFDETDPNKVFGHTFDLNTQGISKGTIQSAQLEICLKALPNNATFNDTISLLFVDGMGMPKSDRWTHQIGDIFNGDGLYSSWWFYPATFALPLDLANLPLSPFFPSSKTNLLTELDKSRFLDIYIQDNTAVEYVALQIQVKVPEPGISLFGLMGLIALGAGLRPRKIHQN